MPWKATTTGQEPSDLAKHKKTLPLIYALETAAESDRARLREILAKENALDADLDEARAILERSGAREYTRERARTERDEALRRLESAGVVGVDARYFVRYLAIHSLKLSQKFEGYPGSFKITVSINRQRGPKGVASEEPSETGTLAVA